MQLKKENEIQHKHQFSLSKETRDYLLEKFKELKESVALEVFVKSGENDSYNEVAVAFSKELAALSNKITTTINIIGEEKSNRYKVTRSPTVLISPDLYQIRYTGVPAGEEGRSFVDTILLVSLRQSRLSKTSKDILSKLNEKRHIQVFVTLNCPYCPGQVLHAFKVAIERPDMVSAECVEAMENIEIANRYAVGAVPQTVINDQTISRGLESEEVFVSELVTLQPIETLKEQPHSHEEAGTVDVLIIGAGPAGLTAGIYAARSGLNTLILEKGMIGGQVVITPVVENWPGFRNIPGKQLMDMISAQVRGYVPILEGIEATEIKVGRFIEVHTPQGFYRAKAVILATGASHRKLKVPGENTLYGRGVSYCATCDGFLYKGKKIMVIGGGNTALTDALYLKNLGADVTILNRIGQFKAEKPLQESVQREKIPVIWDTVVEEILGENRVTGIKAKNTKDNTVVEVSTDAVFVAIGEDPNVYLASELGVKLTESGYVAVDEGGRTNIPRIYAAGDVTGGVRQIVTAVGRGATAAVTVFDDLSSQSR